MISSHELHVLASMSNNHVSHTHHQKLCKGNRSPSHSVSTRSCAIEREHMSWTVEDMWRTSVTRWHLTVDPPVYACFSQNDIHPDAQLFSEPLHVQ